MNKEDAKGAFLILEAAEQGRPVEFLAQFIASYIMSGELMSDTSTSLSFLSAVFQRVDELLCKETDIWPTLLPGGWPPDAPMFSVVEGDAFDVTAVKDDFVALKLLRKAHSSGQLRGTMVGEEIEKFFTIPKEGEERIGPAVKNIVLTYKLIVKPDPDTSLFCDGAEFFTDEQHVQWVKFVPHNGYEKGKEHMFRTDSIYAVVKDTR